MIYREDYFFREAAETDCDILFHWANDEAVRKTAFSEGKIAYNEHLKWFQEKLKSTDSKIFILLYKNIPIGQIRIDMCDDMAEISYSISSKCRNQGHGKNLLLLLEDELKASLPYIMTLVSKVRKNNFASKRVFETIGYNEYYTEYRKEVGNSKINTLMGGGFSHF